MATVLHRQTRELRESVHTPDYPARDWLINPELPPIAPCYWVIEGEAVRGMTAAERAVVDAQRAADDEAAQWAGVRIERQARLLLGDVLEAKVWDGYRNGQYLAAQRDQLLTQVAHYRQALRDVTITYAHPAAVVWPVVPSLLTPYVPSEYLIYVSND